MLNGPNDNSGVYVGVTFGFEVQIDERAQPDGAAIHRPGPIYSFKGATDGPLNCRPEHL
jgi:hypothetical protein